MKSPIKTYSNDDNLNISTKIYSQDRLDSKGSMLSPRSVAGFDSTRGQFRSVSNFTSNKQKQSNSKRDLARKQAGRFEYSDSDIHYKELIRITSVEKLPLKTSNANYMTISNDSQKYNVSNIFSPIKNEFSNTTDPSPFRKYKRAYPPINLDQYRPLVETDTNKLKKSINEYVLDGLELSEFKRILIKNNIDPKESKVEKIITELEFSGPSGSINAIDKLKTLKDCKSIEIDAPKIFDQKLTSFENVTILNKTKDSNSFIDKVENNINLGSSKRKNYDSKHHTDSSEFPLLQNTKTIKSIKIKDCDSSLNRFYDPESSRSKKIDFMHSSTAFKVEKDPLDNSKFIRAYSKTVEENSKNKNLLVHNIKQLRSESKNAETERNNSVKKYKNDYSDDNVLNTFGKTERELSKQSRTIKSIKIVGLSGKGKALHSQTEVNQLTSTLDLNWKNPKANNDFPKTKYGSFYDESHEIKNNKKSKVKMFDKTPNNTENKKNENQQTKDIKDLNNESKSLNGFFKLKERSNSKPIKESNSGRPLISKLANFNTEPNSKKQYSFLSLVKKGKGIK